LECGGLPPLSWPRLAAAVGSKLPGRKGGGKPPHSKGVTNVRRLFTALMQLVDGSPLH
jgi:hypothetical protein